MANTIDMSKRAAGEGADKGGFATGRYRGDMAVHGLAVLPCYEISDNPIMPLPALMEEHRLV